MARSPWRIAVSAILHGGAPRREQVSGEIPDMFVTGSEVPPGAQVEADVVLDALGGAIEVVGTISAPWTGPCRRCLGTAAGRIEADVRERFEAHPVPEETWPLVRDEVDLEPMAREAILVELPAAPLCRDDCRGLCPTCGADRNEGDCDCEPANPPAAT